MNNNEKLSINDMKRISNEIFNKEKEENNIELNILPLTYIEYYNDYVFEKKYSLVKTAITSVFPLIATGFNDMKGNTVIFLNQINKIEKINNKLFRLAFVCYHEARHSIQQKFNKYSYKGFLLDIDNFLEVTSPIDYIKEHDKYSFEIDANLYGLKKSEKYLKNNYPNYYEKEKNNIDKLEKKYQFDYITYDAADTIERTINMLKKTYDIKNNMNWYSLTEISPVLEIFLNEDANFKQFDEIIKNDKFKKIDKEIIYAFFLPNHFCNKLA